jgi:dTDP-4-amino-4,6-dideoxygalactose transaminase
MRPTFPSAAVVAEDYDRIRLSGIFTNSGPVEHNFSLALANWIGQDVGVALVSSGTAGLQLAIQALFLPRRRALVASFTFAAGPLMLKLCGYEPIFIDISENDLQPDLSQARGVLENSSQSVGGILLTNTFGIPNVEIGFWEDLAFEFNVPLIIDSAAGFGSAFPSGKSLGASGDCEIFSLHATKALAIGEGGAISSRDPNLIERLVQLKNFGFDTSGVARQLGTNAKLPELSSAIGLRQLAELHALLQQRREFFALYKNALDEIDVWTPPLEQHSALPFVSAVMPSCESRDLLMKELSIHHIESRCYYNPPVDTHDVFASSPRVGGLETTAKIAARIISLPIGGLHHDEVERVIRAVQDCATRWGAE